MRSCTATSLNCDWSNIAQNIERSQDDMLCVLCIMYNINVYTFIHSYNHMFWWMRSRSNSGQTKHTPHEYRVNKIITIIIDSITMCLTHRTAYTNTSSIITWCSAFGEWTWICDQLLILFFHFLFQLFFSFSLTLALFVQCLQSKLIASKKEKKKRNKKKC